MLVSSSKGFGTGGSKGRPHSKERAKWRFESITWWSVFRGRWAVLIYRRCAQRVLSGSLDFKSRKLLLGDAVLFIDNWRSRRQLRGGRARLAHILQSLMRFDVLSGRSRIAIQMTQVRGLLRIASRMQRFSWNVLDGRWEGRPMNYVLVSSGHICSIRPGDSDVLSSLEDCLLRQHYARAPRSLIDTNWPK